MTGFSVQQKNVMAQQTVAKTHLAGGTMCPSYMATRNEKDTTRARANVLREILTRSESANPFAHQEIYEVMDLCLACKGCASECPSNVNVATLKAEFLYQYYKKTRYTFSRQSDGEYWQTQPTGLGIAGTE